MEGLTILYCLILSLPPIFILSRLGRKKGAMENKKLPPGPSGLLFVAKFFLLGRSIFQIGPILRELHARHGPIISIWLVRTFVFIADRRLAHSILIKGKGNFDERPPPSEVLHLMFPQSIVISSYGSYWRLVRRNLNMNALQPSRLRLFAQARQRVRDAMVSSLRRDASKGDDVTVRPLLGNGLFELLVYMTFCVSPGPEALHELQEMQLQVFLSINCFPIFSFFPAITKRILRKRWAGLLSLRQRRTELLLPLIRTARGAEAPPCYADSLLELRVAEEGNRPLTEEEMVSLCSEFMTGAMDPSESLMEWIMAELVNHPDVQAKLYEEVRDKPELNESDSRGMPYLKAVVLEGLRLHPGGHLVFPHGVLSDAEVGGYMVPKGAEINFLVADFGLDETVWTAPREFRPERFLEGGEDQLDITGTREIKMAPFGAGRRMCPGYNLAILHAEYFVGSLVREFEWLPPAQGEATVDMTEDLNSVIRMKHRLHARIIPRT